MEKPIETHHKNQPLSPIETHHKNNAPTLKVNPVLDPTSPLEVSAHVTTI